MNLPATIQGLQNLAAGDALAKAGRFLPRVAIAALTVLIAWEAARLTWLLLPKPKTTAPMVSAPPPPTSRAIDAQRIANAHLFGVANAANDADLANAPQTQIPLVLAGTIASTDPTKGFAFIGESTQTAKMIPVGQMVASAAKLHSVYPDRVMLDRGGRIEALLLPRPSLGGFALSQPPPAPAQPARFPENLKRLAETNPAAFSEIVRPQAFISGGQMQGFRVYPGRNRQQFAKLGLQPGDLVKAINGTPLDDPQRSGEIFNTLSVSDRAQLTVERNGQIHQITLNTSQIELPDGNADPRSTLPQGMPPQDPRSGDLSGAPVQ